MSRCDEQRILGVMPSILLCILPNDGGECNQRTRMRRKRNAHASVHSASAEQFSLLSFLRDEVGALAGVSS